MTSINTTVNNNTAENKAFNSIYSAIEKVIPYDATWNNGTGYFDGAARSVVLASGEMAKSHTPDTNNRKLIFLGTMFGTMVLFERFTDGQNGVITANVPMEISRLQLAMIPSGRYGAQQIADVFGAVCYDDQPASFYPTTALPVQLENMRDVFSGEYRRKINERLAAEEG